MAEEVLRTPAKLRMPLSLVHTSDAVALAVLRIGLGVVMFVHGAQKLLGWFGGPGFSATVSSFSGQLGVPPPLGVLVILGEFFGALMLLTGFLTRIGAFAVAVIMIGAIFLVHMPHGFFMNWSGMQAGEGFEFHLLALAMCLALMLGGGGVGSVDRLIEVSATRGNPRVD